MLTLRKFAPVLFIALGASHASADDVDCASKLSAYAAYASTKLPDRINFVVYEVVTSSISPTSIATLFSSGKMGGANGDLTASEPLFSSQADAFKKQINRLVVELAPEGDLRLGVVLGPLKSLMSMTCSRSDHGAQAKPGLFVNGTLQSGYVTNRYQVILSKWYQARVPNGTIPTGVLIRD